MLDRLEALFYKKIATAIDWEDLSRKYPSSALIYLMYIRKKHFTKFANKRSILEETEKNEDLARLYLFFYDSPMWVEYLLKRPSLEYVWNQRTQPINNLSTNDNKAINNETNKLNKLNNEIAEELSNQQEDNTNNQEKIPQKQDNELSKNETNKLNEETISQEQVNQEEIINQETKDNEQGQQEVLNQTENHQKQSKQESSEAQISAEIDAELAKSSQNLVTTHPEPIAKSNPTKMSKPIFEKTVLADKNNPETNKPSTKADNKHINSNLTQVTKSKTTTDKLEDIESIPKIKRSIKQLDQELFTKALGKSNRNKLSAKSEKKTLNKASEPTNLPTKTNKIVKSTSSKRSIIQSEAEELHSFEYWLSRKNIKPIKGGIGSIANEEIEIYTETMAKLYEKQGDFNKALTIYEKLANQEPNKNFTNKINNLKRKIKNQE